MVDFHNPYHFVAVNKNGPCDAYDMDPEKLRKLRDGHHHVTHDRYLAETTVAGQPKPVYSGRIICRLTTKTPVVVGNQHRKDEAGREPTEVKPFALANGDPVIPATTLLGLISSVAEAASNSALRVLEDKVLSHRTPVGRSLSAIGMIVQGQDGLTLRPLALPTLFLDHGAATLPVEYRRMFPRSENPPFRVYTVGSIRAPIFSLQTYRRGAPGFVYAQLQKRTWDAAHAISIGPNSHIHTHGAAVLSQTTVDGQPPAPTPSGSARLYERMIPRVLGVAGRDDIPGNKTHELFLPYPEGIEKTPTFPIEPEAIKRFEAIADECTQARKESPFLPYEPCGTIRNPHPKDDDDHTLRLKPGDLVYFRPAPDGKAVAEVSFSSVWRSWGETVYEHFRKISPEKLPFNWRRKTISIAEQMFGFVEDVKGRSPSPDNALALAGRLRFSEALLDPRSPAPHLATQPVLLKVLGTPKPPQPAFYFKKTSGTGPVPLGSLCTGDCLPQGRKFYLHGPEGQGEPWITSRQREKDAANEKSRVRPIPVGQRFYFHIDFNNLSRTELALLCYALKPAAAFCHKVGMGKPLGLGTVQIEPEGLFLVDRPGRYAQADLFGQPRYRRGWTSGRGDEWPAQYAREKREAPGIAAFDKDFDGLSREFRDTMDADIRGALELLGDRSKVRLPVHTPQVAGMDLEEKTYQWFVKNNKMLSKEEPGTPQYLVPLTGGAPVLTVLHEGWGGAAGTPSPAHPAPAPGPAQRRGPGRTGDHRS